MKSTKNGTFNIYRRRAIAIILSFMIACTMQILIVPLNFGSQSYSNTQFSKDNGHVKLANAFAIGPVDVITISNSSNSNSTTTTSKTTTTTTSTTTTTTTTSQTTSATTTTTASTVTEVITEPAIEPVATANGMAQC